MVDPNQMPKRSLREAIAHYIKNPPENSRVFTIMPDDAKWIEQTYNTGENRSKKQHKIKTFAADMAANRWGLTGDTLKFSDEGVLVDGQNRCAACVRANVPFRTHICFGVAHGLFSFMDRGKVRSGGDVLAIAGYTNTTTLSAAVRWTHLISTGRAKVRDTFEPSELLDLLKNKYPGLPDVIPHAMAIHRSVGSPPGLTAAILYLASLKRPKGPKDWQDFARVWELGGQDKSGPPLKKMLAALSTLQTAAHGRVHETVRAALAIIAWNCFVRGQAGKTINFRWTLSDKFPEMLSR